MGFKEDALLILAPDKEWSIQGTTLVWHSEGPYPTDQEIDAKASELESSESLRLLRLKRNEKLTESDWVVVRATETNTEIPQSWKTYRQALRDITQTYQSLDNVAWPSEPS
tara:strand:+ start:614 stop:946 length:333 start_codon:yes stop_codon:yes gene_type:complete